jgi:hypothetical protein
VPTEVTCVSASSFAINRRLNFAITPRCSMLRRPRSAARRAGGTAVAAAPSTQPLRRVRLRRVLRRLQCRHSAQTRHRQLRQQKLQQPRCMSWRRTRWRLRQPAQARRLGLRWPMSKRSRLAAMLLGGKRRNRAGIRTPRKPWSGKVPAAQPTSHPRPPWCRVPAARHRHCHCHQPQSRMARQSLQLVARA